MNPSSLIIAITGGSASGKTRLAHSIAATFSQQNCFVIPEDDYYIDAGNQPGFNATTFNFDEPAAKDHTLLANHLTALKSQTSIQSPQYDFNTHCRAEHTIARRPTPIILVEGLHLLSTPELAQIFDLTVFVEASDTCRLERRISRDMDTRGRSKQSVIDQFNTHVRPMHIKHVEPQKALCDIQIENNGSPDFSWLGQDLIEQINQRLPILQSH